MVGMSDPTHIIVSLSPETIEALATAMRRPSVSRREVFTGTSATTPEREPHSAPLLIYRKPYATEVTRISVEDVERAAKDRPEFTMRALLSALGIPEERQDRSVQTRIGAALRRLGYTVIRRDTRTPQERYYGIPKHGAPVVE